MKSSKNDIPRVALLIETTRSYTREVLAGVRRYLAEAGPWSTFIELRALDSPPPRWLRKWKGDGILTRTFGEEMNQAILSTKLPAVELRSTSSDHSRPFVGADNALIGQRVAEHFLSHGYRNFGVYGIRTETFFIQRIHNFVKKIESSGLPCFDLDGTSSANSVDWERSQESLSQQLQKLPKPIGIFCANDQLGVSLLDACLRGGIAVPKQVAVVGCENEETLCTFASPPLTSVELDGRRIGYEAAQLLDQLMSGLKAPKKTTLIPPLGIVTRESSDDLVIMDHLVARACQLIREQSSTGIAVQDLCQFLNVSRSTLERRMKRAIQRSPKEEILRIRFRDVERLLRVSNLTIADISDRTGFKDPNYLQMTFKRCYGITPGQFRKANQIAPLPLPPRKI